MGVDEVTTYEQLKGFIEGAFELIGADFMQFRRQYPGNNIVRWDAPEGGCFAYKTKLKHYARPEPPTQSPASAEDFIELKPPACDELSKRSSSTVKQFHYLGYCHPAGEQLKYVVYAHKRPIACLGWSSAPRHIGCRDRFIGMIRPCGPPGRSRRCGAIR